jgi:hypothetical protein
MIAVFSAGNARDLIRGFRECVLSGEPGILPEPLQVWDLLFSRRLESIRDRVAIAGGPPRLREQFVPLLQLETLESEDDVSAFRHSRKSMHAYIDESDQAPENVLVAQRFLRYSAEIEVLLRARTALASRTSEEWSKAASYLMSAYQILPFSLGDCESLLDNYDEQMSRDKLGTLVVSSGISPLELPVSDRTPTLSEG